MTETEDDFATSDDEKPNVSVTTRSWLHDRVKGKSKIGEHHPPCFVCFVPPCVGWCPRTMEDNGFCRAWGRVGMFDSKNAVARSRLLMIGLICNLVALVLCTYAAFGISSDPTILRNTSYSVGTVNVDPGPSVRIRVGLKGFAVERPFVDETVVVPFDDLCAEVENGSVEGILLRNDGDCAACAGASSSMVSTVILSAFTCLPSIFTDILRSYSNYDLNCQKCFATLLATFSFLTTLSTFLVYQRSCFTEFNAKRTPIVDILFGGTSEVQVDDEFLTGLSLESVRGVYAEFLWDVGPGLFALYLATAFKVVDIVCNVLIPTPTIARDRKEQDDYERLCVEQKETEE